MGKLDRKVAVITGAARGIGKQIAVTFASEGADIVIGDVIDMETSAEEVRGLGRTVITVKTDVTKKEQVKNLIGAAVKHFKKVDILVNDAGTFGLANVLDMTEEDWDFVLGVNLKGVFLCTQAAASYMAEAEYGKIINIASLSGLNMLVAKQAHYAVSKAGVIQFTRICALELGPFGINVNAIAPGLIISDITRMSRTPTEVEHMVEWYKKHTCLHKVGVAQDIADLALFLASDDSRSITGQVIASDEGWIS